MNSTLTISSANPATIALDYQELRAEGLAYLEKIVSSLWTDYNIHDPGITLLELLCFGITDIAYRTSFPDEDLFASSALADPKNPPFITARNSLTCEPITANDYRRLILDAFYQDVRNVWVEPTTQALFADSKTRQLSTKKIGSDVEFAIQGLYNIRLQLTQKKRNASQLKKLTDDVRVLYHKHRGLAEDLDEVSVTNTHPIMVCADIRLAPDADIEKTFAAIVHRLQNFLTPSVPRYRLAQLVAEGYSIDEIFDGPALTNGFILEKDLDASTTVNVVRSSDLIAEILRINGVLAIPKILLNHAGAKESASELWELEIPLDREPELVLENARLRFYKDLIPFEPDLLETQILLDELIAKDIADADFPDAEDFPVPEGRSLDLSSFTTLQEALPAVYGCGSRGTNRDRSPAALGKARQLKVFLLVFDQMLANYLGQLVNLTKLFSADRSLVQTLFTNAVSDLPDLQFLLKDCAGKSKPLPEDAASIYDSVLNPEVAPNFYQVQQRSKLLNHLLARFGESFADHVLVHYTAAGKRSLGELASYKAIFLSEISTISSRRATGYDYTDKQEIWNTKNVSGFKHRLERLLGFPTFTRRSLSEVTYDYYEESDEDAKSEVRFRIVDRRTLEKKTLLSGTTKYKTKENASAALRHAVQLGMNSANYDIKQAKNGKWYVVIVDRTIAGGDIVAMRKQYFEDLSDAEKTRDFLIEAMAENFSEEGSFIVEHLLMRPRKKEWPLLAAPLEAIASVPQSWDPYSHYLHIIMPGWGTRFEKPPFRAFVEQVIRRELPAHLIARVCFVSRDHMREFEGCYQDWLKALANQTADMDQMLVKLITCLETIHTIYPSGTLHDCVEDGDEQNLVVLGRTHLGSIKPKDS